VPVTESQVLLRHETLIDKPIPNCILNVTLFWRAGTTERGLSISSDVAMERHNQPVEISPSECSTLPAYVSSNSPNKKCLLLTDNHHYKTSTPQGKTSLVKTCRRPSATCSMPCGYKEVRGRRPALFSTTRTVLTRQEPAEAQDLFCLFIAVTEKVFLCV